MKCVYFLNRRIYTCTVNKTLLGSGPRDESMYSLSCSQTLFLLNHIISMYVGLHGCRFCRHPENRIISLCQQWHNVENSPGDIHLDVIHFVQFNHDSPHLSYCIHPLDLILLVSFPLCLPSITYLFVCSRHTVSQVVTLATLDWNTLVLPRQFHNLLSGHTFTFHNTAIRFSIYVYRLLPVQPLPCSPPTIIWCYCQFFLRFPLFPDPSTLPCTISSAKCTCLTDTTRPHRRL